MAYKKKQCYVMLGFSEKVCEHQGVKMKLYEAIGGSLTTTGSVGNKFEVGKTYP